MIEFESDADFIQQIVREISSSCKNQYSKSLTTYVIYRDQPRPSQLWFDPNSNLSSITRHW